MFPEEHRSVEDLRMLQIAEAISNPDGPYATLTSLNGKDQLQELARLEVERQKMRRDLDRAQQKVKDLERKVATLQSEAKQASLLVKNLRQSKSMKIGRALTSPVRSGRNAARDPKGEAKKSLETFKRAGKRLRAIMRRIDNWLRRLSSRITLGNGIAITRESHVVAPPRGSADPSMAPEKLRTPESFERLLNQMWYTEGRIEASAKLVKDNPELAERSSEKAQILSRQILGVSRMDYSVLVPPRSFGAAYVPEPSRVLYFVHQTPVFNSNGYSTRTRGVAKGLRSQGVDVVVVARSGYPWDSSTDVSKPRPIRYVKELDSIPYVHLTGGNLNRDPIDQYVLQCADAFVREARMQRPTVIHAASNFRTALPALIAARRVGVPFVYEVRGLWELTEATSKPGFEKSERFALMRELETFVASEADRVLAITQQVKEELVARGVDAGKIAVVPNAVDPDVFLPLPRDASYAASKHLASDVPVIGFAGSMVDYEGLDLLLEAAAILRDRGVPNQIVLAGSGTAEAGLKRLSVELGLEDTVHFLGRLPQNEMPRLQSTFDIVCCPRRSTLVTDLVSPLKPLEAFAASKATVLSDVAPNLDQAGDYESRAITFRAGDAEDLAEVLERVIGDAELRADLGRTARLWTVKERSWATIGSIVREAYGSARENFDGELCQAGLSRRTQDLRVGVIADEFTRASLESSFNVEYLDRNRWHEQLVAERQLDLIIVESAWEGNNGQWHRGVGHYSEEESADLRGVLEVARELGIPTLFWNKEDPVHFERFAPNAALFEHVFTTDANMIPRYHQTPGQRNQTVSALPFYAQPEIHNPLPTERPFHQTVAYAGSYYGDRYKERSQGLEKLLSAAKQHTLEIYDRQASNPESPYKFPKEYQTYVQGALPYSEVINSYRTHLAHLNVNSVMNSPTMFSRRVVEIPACGGLVLSAYGRGVAETLGSNIAQSNLEEDYRAWLYDWSTNPRGRLNEIWRQMRTIYRSHTTHSALAVMTRTAGISVRGVELVRYVARLSDSRLSSEERRAVIQAIPAQSVRPLAVMRDGLHAEEVHWLEDHGICVIDSLSEMPVDVDNWRVFEVIIGPRAGRTWAEDVLLPTRFGDFSEIAVRHFDDFEIDCPVVEITRGDEAADTRHGGIVAHVVDLTGERSSSSVVAVTLPSDSYLPAGDGLSQVGTSLSEDEGLAGKTVVLAGHDLKFAQGIIGALEAAGAQVHLDVWESHTKHDDERSLELLNKADIVFCEWGLGNAVWYSQRVRSDQTLVVRVHSQELFRPFLEQIATASVDTFIFVGELIRTAAVESHGIPRSKTVVIPNPVDVDGLTHSKPPSAQKTIGMVGIVPRSKRLDRALDVIEMVLEQDPEFKLRIKGKTPDDYPWMKNRPEEMEYYAEQYRRIDEINALFPGAVQFDEFGPDMASWYKNVGVVLSVSDFESFHLTIADGAASGAIPAVLNWPGADRIYPAHWLSGSTKELAKRILDQVEGINESEDYSAAIAQMAAPVVMRRILDVVRGHSQ
ncbi:glycosyltransferase [Corynebacterium sp. LK2510]|uniref:glycosyltransferase n=1 Tax=Corynebacterium sp. LK2510 TaxID=3110472 RepID=UPI0034CE35FB